MIIKINKVITLSKYGIVLFLSILLVVSCSKNCKTVEYYNDGTPKLKVCILGNKNNYYHHTTFYENGNMEYQFYLLNDKLEGKFTEYYQTGLIKEVTTFKNGKKNGDDYSFLKNGKIDLYNFFVENKVIYVKDYLYNSENQSFIEGFIPILKFQQDTIEATKSSIEFEVSLPIPDSLLQNRKLYFAYEMKPLSLKDSIIEFPVNELLLDNKKVFSQSIELEEAATQIFYGHIIDKEENHIYQPFEKIITVLKKELLQ